MNTISLRKGIMLFVLVFIAPAIVLQPVRPAIAGFLPAPTLWQSATMVVSTLLVAGLAIYAYNQRQRIRELEREIERQKYRIRNNMGD